ncbi:Aspartyl/glutamyl-tRNA(Asn/Gln) amidotransferase subunit C [Desulfamplus magnetovallimortis]|uniref:Aspartyl/glutamyl-tRNA(Asn/Gln) amidotransferase subunit C n=1 Tax=Desulfamplus magnetovallimortis TaxID=1246637 RepID=A0A1W1HA73_9BACT|nr:Asp-tRNA(Asn)/Glu-tRNA(Gln) amidotransferase subunit GatC [Desulfamplus magnetovallimortis]SLM29322.1 Aspartyl/glutamyl-tRNA(Asn/Gln) amidotransferase subunit C [Desulfamplus magnetovallimortis]
MKISRKDVEYIAHLARLEVDDLLVDKFADQISNILEYIDKLKDADVSGAELMSGAAFQNNVMREDIVKVSPGPDVTLSDAPERDEDFYVVPRVVG